MDGQELAEREDPYRPATGPVYDTSHMRLVDSSPPTRWLGQMDAAVVQRPDQHTTYDRRSNSRSLCVRGMVNAPTDERAPLRFLVLSRIPVIAPKGVAHGWTRAGTIRG